MIWRVGGGNGGKRERKEVEMARKGGEKGVERGGIGVTLRLNIVFFFRIVMVSLTCTSNARLCHVMSCNMI